MRNNPLKARIYGLYRQQERLGRQLDKAYLRDNITDYLALEAKHRRIAMLIQRLMPKLDASSRRELFS